MNRNEVATELLLRENIRRIINTVKQGKIDERRERILTENALRKVIRKLLN